MYPQHRSNFQRVDIAADRRRNRNTLVTDRRNHDSALNPRKVRKTYYQLSKETDALNDRADDTDTVDMHGTLNSGS